MNQLHSNGGQSDGSDQVSATETTEPKDVGLVGRLFGIFHSPSSSFAVINNKWEWLWVTLVLVVLGIGSMQLQKPYLLPDLKSSAMSSLEDAKDNIPAETYLELREQIETDIAANFELSPKPVAIAFIAGTILTLLIGLLCWGLGNFISGSKAKLWQVLAIVAFSGMISLVHDYLRVALMTMNGTSYVYLGLGLLKPESDSSFLYYLLRQMEFITMWKLAAMSIAFAALYKTSTARFVYALLPIWLIFIALVAGANLVAGGTIVY